VKVFRTVGENRALSFVIVAALVVTVVAMVGIPLMLSLGKSIAPQTVSVIKVALLWIAGVLSGLMTLMILAAAAWGMDTRMPWGLGIYMYLIPALSLPAFFLLKFSVRTLSIVLWLLTVSNAIAWFFGDRADRLASGMRPLSDPNEILGMFLNAFTLLYLVISVLVQLAELCTRKGRCDLASTERVV
jgi:hypothetical protein